MRVCAYVRIHKRALKEFLLLLLLLLLLFYLQDGGRHLIKLKA